jgi:hypothetical protein
MATPKRRWPKAANEARLLAIDNLGEIQVLLKKAKLALRKRNLDLTLSLMAQTELLAQMSQMALENVPTGEELNDD